MKNKNSRLNPNIESISERLKRLRTEARLSQAALASRVNKSQSQISDLEKGKAYLATDELPDFASALGTTISYLVTGNEPEHETISAELGLSNKTINRLSKYVKKGDTSFSDAINLLFIDSDEPDSVFCTSGETILLLFAEFVHCPERELLVKTINPNNAAFALTRDEALQLRLINSLTEFRKNHKEFQNHDLS